MEPDQTPHSVPAPDFVQAVSQGLSDKWAATYGSCTSHYCPCCGRVCPTCGRPRYVPPYPDYAPYYPWPTYPSPYYWVNNTSGAFQTTTQKVM